MAAASHGRGCACEKCDAKRAKARAHYDKYRRKGSPERTSDPRVASNPMMAPKASGPTGRMIETKTASSMTTHWMPKTGTEWSCDYCGAQFFYHDGTWRPRA